MEQKEKSILVSLISSILILGFYSLYVYKKFISGSPEVLNDFSFWGKAFLILIPVTIVVQIIIQIAFAIIHKISTGEDIATMTDERDKLIELRAIKISHWIFITGFLLAMGSQAIAMPAYTMFILLISSGFASSIISDMVRIYFYRRGF